MTARIFAVWLAVCAGSLTTPLVAEEAAVPSFSAAGDHDASQRISEALRKPLPEAGLEFDGTPLEQIIENLREEYGVEILIDRPALEDLGIDETQPISVRLRNVSLQAALKLMLKELELTYVVANEVLLITTQEEADTRLSVRVYPVRDLLDPNYAPTDADKKSGTPAELIPIKDALISAVASDTWAENGGGEAEIRPLRPGLLVISQTQAVHEEIRNTLAAIRRGKQFAQDNQSPPTAEGAMAGQGGMPYGGEGGMGYGGEMGRGGYRGEGGFGAYGGEFGGRAALPRKATADDDPFGRPSAEPSKKAAEGDPFAE